MQDNVIDFEDAKRKLRGRWPRRRWLTLEQKVELLSNELIVKAKEYSRLIRVIESKEGRRRIGAS